MQQDETTLLSWSAPEFIHRERKVDWFWAVGTIGVAGAVIAFLTNNFLFAMFILFATGILLYLRSKPAEDVTCTITTRGIYIQKTFYSFEKITDFWVHEDAEESLFLFHTGTSITSVLSVHFQDPTLADRIRESMPQDIDETFLAEPLSTQILNKLGF
jgi:hypothetical protein